MEQQLSYVRSWQGRYQKIRLFNQINIVAPMLLAGKLGVLQLGLISGRRDRLLSHHLLSRPEFAGRTGATPQAGMQRDGTVLARAGYPACAMLGERDSSAVVQRNL